MPHNKMNPDVKPIFVAALRSGRFKQGHGKLRSAKDEYCCLGVLCALYDEAHNENNFEHPNGTKHVDPHSLPKIDFDFYHIGSSSYPDEQVQQWSGISRGGYFLDEDNGDESSLVTQNDDNNKSFDEIANIVEKYF